MNQHYVPQVYQKGWKIKVGQQDNQIWVYEKGRQPALRSIKKSVACAEDHYAFTDLTGNSDSVTVENWLSDLERRTGPVLKKIYGFHRLDPQERKQLAEFMCVFWQRVPLFQDRHHKILSEYSPKHFEWAYQTLKHLGIEDDSFVVAGLKQFEEKHRQGEMNDYYYSQIMMKPVARLTEAIAKMDWTFYKAPPGFEFLTSDNPFIFNRATGIGHWTQGFILFPVSREVCLQCTNVTRMFGHYETAHSDNVRDINLLIMQHAHKQVYGAKKWSIWKYLTDKHLGARNQDIGLGL